MFEKLAINIIISLIEIVIMHDVYKKYNTSPKFNYIILLGVGVGNIIWTVLNTLYLSVPIYNAIAILIISFSVSFAAKIRLWLRLLCSVTISLVIIGCEFITSLVVSSILKVSAEELLAVPRMYLMLAIISKFTAYVVIKVFVKLIKPKSKDILDKNNYLYLMLPVASMIVVFMLGIVGYSSVNNVESIMIILSCLCIVTGSIATMVIYEQAILKESEIKKKDIALVKINSDKKHYEEIANYQIISNKALHDLKNELFMFKEINMDNTQHIALIDKICSTVSSHNIVQYTKMQSVDALLNAKMISAVQVGANIKYEIILHSDIWVDRLDMCLVLGNLLDNAIDAVKVTQNKTIIMKIRQVYDNLVVMTSNETINIIEDDIETNKKHKESHGNGLKNIIAIVKKYEGNIQYRIENNEFTCVLNMYNRS